MSIGGQAVIEGVMMRNKEKVAVATRDKDKVKLKKQEFNSLTKKYKALGWPFIRGIINLFEILLLGIKTLNYSANEASKEDSDDGDIPVWQLVLSIVVALAAALLIFKLIPLGITKLLFNKGVITNRITFNLFDGLLRIALFVLYIVIIAQFSDIKRVFQYHGAEHKAVYCHEDKKELIVENVRKYSTLHPRCGTSFIFIVLIAFIFIISLIPVDYPLYILFFYRLPFILPIAGISYEILKWSDKYRNSRVLNLIAKPGLWIQRLTTKEPDDKQIEVAITALKGVL